MTPFDLLLACAPLISPITMTALIEHESGVNPLAIHDNTNGASYQPRTEAQAVLLAQKLISAGHSLDLGISQINNKNLSWIGQTVQTIFNPCVNLNAAQTILIAAWKQSKGDLPGTLSVYNTGKVNSSIGADYAAAVYSTALHPIPIVPAIPGGKLPGWITKEISGTEKTNPEEILKMTPEMFQSIQTTTMGTDKKPVNAIIKPPTEIITPANSSINPDEHTNSKIYTPANSPINPLTQNAKTCLSLIC
jgi:type IV secretion system protein VirB1